jgi:hypothetical protein
MPDLNGAIHDALQRDAIADMIRHDTARAVYGPMAATYLLQVMRDGGPPDATVLRGMTVAAKNAARVFEATYAKAK